MVDTLAGKKIKWKLCSDALEGEGGFDDGDYIIQYSRESDDKHTLRKDIAYFENFMKPSVNRYIGFLYKKNANRVLGKKLQNMLLDIDMRGNSIDVFMQDFITNAKAKGSGVIVVDMLPTNRLNERPFPYFVEVDVNSITDYKLDDKGAFEYIAFQDFIDVSTYKTPNKMDEVIRYFDKDAWAVYKGTSKEELYKDKDGNQMQGDHNLGICPAVAFTEKGLFPCVGEYYQIADINKRIYNLDSELDEVLRGQTFNILTYDSEGKDTKDLENISIGVNNMLLYQGSQPSFISPSGISAETIQNKINVLKEMINDIALKTNKTNTAETAEALKYKLEDLNASLTSYSERIQDFEIRLFEIAKKWLKSENMEISIEYPKDFKISDLISDIAIAQEAFSLNMGKTFESEWKKSFALSFFDGMDKDTMDKILVEIENMQSDVENDDN